MDLKQILKQLIEERRISVSELSKKTGVPIQTLHNWLSGLEPRSLKQVKKVADFFEVTLDYLCFGIVHKKNIDHNLQDFDNEINAGIFEVVLRRVKK